MPMYDFKCGAGHEFERFLSLSRLNSRCTCPVCGGVASRVDFQKAPALNFSVASSDRATYAKHNVTFTGVNGTAEESIGFSPNSHEEQCQCEECKRHRRRALVTETADKRKDVAICL
jgi:putative FmdB family regulatory protein